MLGHLLRRCSNIKLALVEWTMFAESQPIAGSMPGNHIQRWPNIETEFGDCPVCALTAIRVTFYPPKGHYRIAPYIC